MLNRQTVTKKLSQQQLQQGQGLSEIGMSMSTSSSSLPRFSRKSPMMIQGSSQSVHQRGAGNINNNLTAMNNSGSFQIGQTQNGNGNSNITYASNYNFNNQSMIGERGIYQQNQRKQLPSPLNNNSNFAPNTSNDPITSAFAYGGNPFPLNNYNNSHNQGVNPFSNNSGFSSISISRTGLHSNTTSQILKMGELMDYLFSKGYPRDAYESFVEYVFQVENVPVQELLSDEIGDNTEEIQLREITVLYKLCMRFSASILSNENSTPNEIDQIFSILKFASKVLVSPVISKLDPPILLQKWNANLYSHLGVHSLRTNQWALAVNYLELSSATFGEIKNTQNLASNTNLHSQGNVKIEHPDDIIDESLNNELNQSFEENELDFSQDKSSNMQSKQQSQIKLKEKEQQNPYSNFSTGGIEESIVLNNLAAIYGMVGEVQKAQDLLLRSVSQSENEVFKYIQTVQLQYLRKDKAFLSKLPVLIYGYLYCEAIARHRQQKNEPFGSGTSNDQQQQQHQQLLQSQSKINNCSPSQRNLYFNMNSNTFNKLENNQFAKNAFKLSKTYFGEDHPLTMKVDVLKRRLACHVQLADILRQTFPFEIDVNSIKSFKLYMQLNNNKYNFIQGKSSLDPLEQQKSKSQNVNKFMIRKGRNKSSNSLQQQQQNGKQISNKFMSQDINMEEFKHQQSPNSSQIQSRIRIQNSQDPYNNHHEEIEDETEQKGNQILRDEVKTLKQTIAKLKSQIQINKGDNNMELELDQDQDNQLMKYKKQNRQKSNTDLGSDVPLNYNGDTEQAYSIQQQNKMANNYKNSSNTQKRHHSSHSSNNIQIQQQQKQRSINSTSTVKDDQNSSNGSFKPSQFKKESRQNSPERGNNTNTQHRIQQQQEQLQPSLQFPQDLNEKLNQIQQKMASLVEFKDTVEKQLKDIRTNPSIAQQNNMNPNISNSKEPYINTAQKFDDQFTSKKQGGSQAALQQVLNGAIPSKSTLGIPLNNNNSNSIAQSATFNNHTQSSSNTNNFIQAPPIMLNNNNNNNNNNIKNNNNSKQIVANTINNHNMNVSSSSSNSSSTPKVNSQKLTFPQNMNQQQQQNPQRISNYNTNDNKNFDKQQQQQQQTSLRGISSSQAGSSIKNQPQQQYPQQQQQQYRQLDQPPWSPTSPQNGQAYIQGQVPQMNIQNDQNMQAIQKIVELIQQNIQDESEFILKKRMKLKDTEDACILKCCIKYSKQQQQQLVIITSSINGTEEQRIINMGVFGELIKYVCYQDVLPSSFNLDSLNSVYDVCKYFILPFIGLDMQEAMGSNKTIKLFPRAQGILNEYYKIQFLNSNVLVQLIGIEGCLLRLIICDQDTAKNNIRIDIEYDEPSFNSLYLQIEKDQYQLNSLLDFTQITKESEASQLGKELVHREIEKSSLLSLQQKQEQQMNGTQEYFVQSVSVKDQSQFMAHFTNLISEFQRIVNEQSIYTSFNQLASQTSQYHFRFRVYQGLKKSMLLVVTDANNNSFFLKNEDKQEQDSSIKKNENAVRVCIFNNFESYTYGGGKLKEKGEGFLHEKDIKKLYGLDYDKLNVDERGIVFVLCSYHYNLRVIEKLQEAQSHKPSQNQANNNILRLQFVTGGQQTMIIKGTDNYLYPVSFEMIGCKDVFIGVKISLYNPIQSIEQSVFLTTNHFAWIFQNEILQKKFLHFTVDTLPLSQFFLSQIFKKVAVPVLFSKINIENIKDDGNTQFIQQSSNYKNKTPELLGSRGFLSDNCTILRLESVLDPLSTVNYFVRH